MSSPVLSPTRSPAEASPPRRAHVARTMFSVPLASPMSDGDVARLARTLNLVTHLHPKLHHSPTSPGVVRLDFDSGLFLVRGANAGEWALEGRTWGNPLPQAVHEWHLSAAVAARQLDTTVALPGKS
jgi:hypothetical protein